MSYFPAVIPSKGFTSLFHIFSSFRLHCLAHTITNSININWQIKIHIPGIEYMGYISTNREN